MSSALAEISDLFYEDVDVAPIDPRPEIQSRLHRLPDSPWRSLGQHLDYSGWKDRDRFVHLDVAIKVQKIRQERIDARARQSRISSVDCKRADLPYTTQR